MEIYLKLSNIRVRTNRKEVSKLNYIVVYSVNYINMPIIVYITLAITIILSFLFVVKRNIIRTRKMMSKLIFVTFVTGVFGIGGAYSHFSDVKALKYGDYKFVEGEVKNFSPASSNLKGNEKFEVDGKNFEYSNASVTGGLNHSIYGIIKNGSIVRVYYKNDDILRIEVEDNND